MRVATLTRISTDEINQPYSLEAEAIGLDAFVASQPGHAIAHRFVDQTSGASLNRACRPSRDVETLLEDATEQQVHVFAKEIVPGVLEEVNAMRTTTAGTF